MKKKIDITNYHLEFENLPASFHGCRIGFFADLHNNEIGLENKYLFDSLRYRHFDYFVCAGDMVIGSDIGVFEYQKTLVFLKKLSTIAPVYYSIGNHEERMRLKEFKNKISVLNEFKKKLKEQNISVLDNQTIKIIKNGQSMCLKGLSLNMDYYKRWWNRKPLSDVDVKKRIGKKEEFTILLAHNPVFFDAYDSYGADLILSGHVHGGLMVIPLLGGVISPELQLFPKYDFGLFQGKNSKMIVSRGLGTHTLPIRIHNRPEFIDITLNRACDFKGQLVE